VIQVQGLAKYYGDFVAVEGLDFAVSAGEILGLVGPNGAGKTTTLRCMVGILRPTAGTIGIDGHDMQKDPVEAKRRLAWLPDEPHLFEYLTVREHLTLTARLYRVEGAEERGKSLLEELELTDKADVLPGELSRGMKQKLAIACGLLHSPQALFFDEPLTGLDPLGIRRMKNSIVQRARAGAAIVLSSHLLHLLEEVCTHVLILKRGTKIADGTIAEVAARFSNGEPNVSLEEIFIRATGGSEG
jgi:ABC-2 type transport system ATP-binding protein